MTSVRKLHAGLILLAWVNMTPVAEAEQSWLLLAVAVAAGVVSLLVIRPGPHGGIPRALLNVFVLASVAYLAYEMFAPHAETTVYVLDLAHFLVILCCCKFFDLRSNRDLGLVVVIAFLVLVIGAFVSGSLVFAAALAVDVTFGIWWVVAFTLKRERDGVVARRRAAWAACRLRLDDDPAAPSGPALLFRFALLGALGLIATAAVVFVALPRGLGRGIIGGIQQVLPGAVTGYGDEAELTSGPLAESDAKVMRVRFTRNGEPYGGPDVQPYLRGATADHYLRGRWRKAPQFEDRIRVGSVADPEPLFDLDEIPDGYELIEQEVWLDHLGGGSLFALYAPVSFGWNNRGTVAVGIEDLSIKVKELSGKSVHYRAASLVPARDAVPLDSADYDAPLSMRRTERPSRRILELADALAERFGDPADAATHARIARGICDTLRGGGYSYTLDRGPLPRGVDPIEDFLFQNKRGHCEYFATAMTLLCQAVGLNARRVGGYYGGEYIPVGGFYQFREKDAHAWVEVNLPGRGWVTFDPSPGTDSGGRSPGLGALAEIGRLIAYLQFEWSTFVVAFDSDYRAEVASRFGDWLTDLTHDKERRLSVIDMAERFLWGPEFLTAGQRAFYWIALVLAAAFVAAVLRVLWILSVMAREWAPRRTRGRRAVARRPEAGFYDRLLLLLARKGYVKPSHWTPREFAVRTASAHPDLSELPELTEWFYEAQYGGVDLARDRRRRVRGLMQRLREDPAFAAEQGRSGVQVTGDVLPRR